MNKYQEFELRQQLVSISMITTSVGWIEIEDNELVFELSKVVERYFKKNVSEDQFVKLVKNSEQIRLKAEQKQQQQQTEKKLESAKKQSEKSTKSE